MEKSMWQMNEALSEMIGSYGLDVWMWVKVMYKDVNTPEAEQQGLAKRRRLFESLPHLDAVFVPGGDGGDTPVEVLMPWLGRLAEVLRDVHPNATLWVSNQTYEAKDNDFFFNYLQTQSPDWLEGVVYGPWTTVSIPEVRRRTPKRYKLRRYPDICHCLGCQYPVPQWDRTFSIATAQPTTSISSFGAHWAGIPKPVLKPLCMNTPRRSSAIGVPMMRPGAC
jgi:hypothetical protein